MVLSSGVFGSAVNGADSTSRSVDVGDGWKIVITPLSLVANGQRSAKAVVLKVNADLEITKQVIKVPAGVKQPLRVVAQITPRKSYGEAYRSVRFSRAEYHANPAYRHEAAMEIMFGKLRPTTIHKYQPAQTIRSSSSCALAPYSPYGSYHFSRGPYSRYPGLFRYRGGYRSLYYHNGGYGKAYRSSH
jgi:hypothetical protein